MPENFTKKGPDPGFDIREKFIQGPVGKKHRIRDSDSKSSTLRNLFV
jgi:hypothetical protein